MMQKYTGVYLGDGVCVGCVRVWVKGKERSRGKGVTEEKAKEKGSREGST